MFREMLRRYIVAYEREFDRIHREEIYKWQAVQWFQKTWHIDAEDFAAMVEYSLKETQNLLAASNYLPKRLIVENAEWNPQAVRAAFVDLFDEERELLERIENFQTRLRELTDRQSDKKRNSYQDHRAIMVYLNVRYPDTYYLYKFEMFRVFAEKLHYDYRPIKGRLTNVTQYLNACERVRDELMRNDRVLKRHMQRIGEKEYSDPQYHILTQDLIYAISRGLTLHGAPSLSVEPRLTLTQVNVEPQQAQRRVLEFQGRTIDFEGQQRYYRRVGRAGEDLVFQFEREKYGAAVEHKSKSEGDGLGYDILSVDDRGNHKYIEVKTTTSGQDTPFFMSANELERSRQEGDRYFLYRLFNFNEQLMAAEYYVLQGDLSQYCTYPTEYQVIPKVEKVGSFGLS